MFDMSTSPLADIRAKLAETRQQKDAAAGKKPQPEVTSQQPAVRSPQPEVTSQQPVVTPPQPEPAVRRKWSEREYRARGLVPPEKRTADERVRVSGKVRPATYEPILACATANGATFGEALDLLLVNRG